MTWNLRYDNMALTKTGKVYTWGYNGNGQLGNATPAASATPIKIRLDGIVKIASGKSVDQEFRAGAKKVMEEVLKQKVELAVLQSRSPSCGVNEIYDGSFSGKKMKGQGVFAKMLMEQGVKVIDVEDIGS